jgi:hypothetical protein
MNQELQRRGQDFDTFVGDSNKKIAVDVREISEFTQHTIYSFPLFSYHIVT